MKFKNLTQKNFILKILEQFVKTNPFLYKFAMILNSHILRNFFPESDFIGLIYINFPKKKKLHRYWRKSRSVSRFFSETFSKNPRI